MTDDAPCIIGEGIQIRGNVSGSGGLVVHGRIEGNIALDGDVEVGERAVVSANVQAQGLTVNGELRGDIDATSLVSIASSGMVIGDIRATELEIQDGARFRGRLDMEVPLPEDV